MFEDQSPHPLSPRYKACLRQCRLARFHAGGSIYDGNCTCERTSQCRFGLPGFGDDEDSSDVVFPDVRKYWKEICEEYYA